MDDLASLLYFARLLHMRTGPAIVRIQYLAEIPNAPETMTETSQRVLSVNQKEAS